MAMAAIYLTGKGVDNGCATTRIITGILVR
jgi:hypothetical protein